MAFAQQALPQGQGLPVQVNAFPCVAMLLAQPGQIVQAGPQFRIGRGLDAENIPCPREASLGPGKIPLPITGCGKVQQGRSQPGRTGSLGRFAQPHGLLSQSCALPAGRLAPAADGPDSGARPGPRAKPRPGCDAAGPHSPAGRLPPPVLRPPANKARPKASSTRPRTASSGVRRTSRARRRSTLSAGRPARKGARAALRAVDHSLRTAVSSAMFMVFLPNLPSGL